jgi:hypothetical protein
MRKGAVGFAMYGFINAFSIVRERVAFTGS